jgi:hypothetical protein
MITYIFEGGSCDAIPDKEKGFEFTRITANNVNLDNGQLPYKLMERILRGKRHATRILALIEADRK